MKTSSRFPGAQNLRRALAVVSVALLFSSAACIHAAETLIPLGATWRYSALGVDLGTAWRETNYNDSAWPAGPSQFGFGDGDEATMVNIGPMNARYSTIYFRHTFSVTNRGNITNVALQVLRDDGAVVYLNGIEALRSNMPESPGTYGTWSAVPVAGAEESQFFPAAIPPALLRSGTNVIAVEIHQSDAGSSDLSFEFQLLANTPLGNQLPAATVSIAPNIVATGQVFGVSVAGFDPETAVTKIDGMQDGTVIRTLLGDSGAFNWSNSVVGIHDYTARAADLTGLMGMSPPERLLVTLPGLQQQSVFFPKFSSPAGLILQSAATVSSNVLHLHQPMGGSRGAAWLAARQSISDGFVSEFWFRITSKSLGGGDGFSFIISGTPQPNIGSGGVSYGGITNSLAVEFDTWMNSTDGDPDDVHISVHSRGVLANTLNESASIGRVTPPGNFTDNSGTLHKVRIDYVPGTLRVFLDDLITPVLIVNTNLGTLLSLPDGRAWIGLAGGTGGSWENHDIWTWSYTSLANVPPTISLTSPAQAIRVAPGTDVVLTADAQDANGVLGVIFFDGSEELGFVEHAPYSLVWTNPAPGIHMVTALTADAELNETLSAPRVVEILPTNANVFMYPTFSASPNLLLQGSATFVLNRARLTPATGSQAGGMWLDTRQSVSFGFETVFQFQVSQPSSQGAEGFAFLIADNESPSLGSTGAGLGYKHISNSLAIEFDMHLNVESGDPDGNHVAIHTGGTGENSSDETAALGLVSCPVNMSDGTIHTVLVRLDHGMMRVFMDEPAVPILEVPVDLGSFLNMTNGRAWVGFTASTGGDYENHDILMWSFRPNTPPQAQPSLLSSPPFGFKFATTTGQAYTVQYSADLVNWTNAVPTLIGDGALLSWHDNGPPGTDSPPDAQPQRFYRVIVAP